VCRTENPYHNSTHAADVVQALVFLLCEDDIHKKFEPLELAAGITAAIIHDVAHPGVNNQFLEASEVCSTCLALLGDPSCCMR
jgi:hypothetical protein